MPAKDKGKVVAHDEQPMEVDNGEGMSAGTLIKKHQAKMAWSMAGQHGGAALYHPQGCQKCDDYVTHAVEASDLNQLNVLRKDIDVRISEGEDIRSNVSGETHRSFGGGAVG